MWEMKITAGSVTYGVEAESEKEALAQLEVVCTDIERRAESRREMNKAMRKWAGRVDRIEMRRQLLHRARGR